MFKRVLIYKINFTLFGLNMIQKKGFDVSEANRYNLKKY